MNSSIYQPRYLEWLNRAGVTENDLPMSLQESIFKFLIAKAALENADGETKARFLPMLVGSDAVIAAAIYRLYKPQQDPLQVNKIKLMALKARAIRIKLAEE